MKNILYLSIVIFFLVSCANNDDTTKKYNPTPYQFSSQIPERDFPIYIPDDNPLTVEGVELGQKLFNEKLLSVDKSLSCTSCHNPEKAFASNNQFDEGFQGKKLTSNTMSLTNLLFNVYLGWEGQSTSLEDAIIHTVESPDEFHEDWDNVIVKLKDAGYSNLFFDAFGTTDISKELVSKAIAQYLRSNISLNSKFDKAYYNQDAAGSFTPQEAAGFQLFMSEIGDCFHCHRVGSFSDNRMHNNGLDANPEEGYAKYTKESYDIGKYKTVSLRNVAITAPYMHDGRYKTLKEVLDFYSGHVNSNSPNLDPNMEHLGPIDLTETEKEAIIAFLNTLTDEKYLDK